MRADEDIVLVGYKTGQVMGELKEGDRILRARTEDYLDNTIEINKKEPFVKVYLKAMFEVSKSIDGTCNQLLNILLPYTSYKTGILTYSNGNKINKKHILKISGLNEKTVDRCINKLIALKVIGKHKTGREVCYTVNPYIFMRGQRVNKTLHEFFKDSRWAGLYKK